MNVSSQNSIQSPVTHPLDSPEAKRAQLQALLFKKSLELLQDQTAQVQREAEGKGHVIDIRV